jgi:hypothetical protein
MCQNFRWGELGPVDIQGCLHSVLAQPYQRINRAPANGQTLMTVDFAGFPIETVSFLKGLKANNNREWFAGSYS